MGACGLLADRTVSFPVDLLRRSDLSASTTSRRPIPNGLHPPELPKVAVSNNAQDSS